MDATNPLKNGYAYFGLHKIEDVKLMGDFAKQIILSNYSRQCMSDPTWNGQPIYFGWVELADGYINAAAGFDSEPTK